MTAKFKIVVLECPYDTWDDPLSKDMFHKMVQLKMIGYKREYPYGVLPVDTSDFVATHHLICLDERGELNPVMAYRTVTLERAKLHSMSLPVLNLMNMIGAKEHAEKIQSIITNCEKQNKSLVYASSLAVHNDHKGNADLRTALRTIHVLYHKDAKIDEIIAGGVIRFKMDKLYEFFGYSDLEWNGKVLPPVAVPFVFNEVTGFYHLRKFSEEAMNLAEANRKLWENRITISKSDSVPLKKVG